MIPAITHEVLKPPTSNDSKTSVSKDVAPDNRHGSITYVFKPAAIDSLCEKSSISCDSLNYIEKTVGTQTETSILKQALSADVAVATESLSCSICGNQICSVESAKSTSLVDKEQRLRKQQLTIEEFILDSRSKLERLRTTSSSLRENIKPKKDLHSGSKNRTPRQQESPMDCFVSVQALRVAGEGVRNYTENVIPSPCISPSPIRRRNINLWAQSPIEPLSKSSFPIVRPVTIEELGELERKK